MLIKQPLDLLLPARFIIFLNTTDSDFDYKSPEENSKEEVRCQDDVRNVKLSLTLNLGINFFT